MLVFIDNELIAKTVVGIDFYYIYKINTVISKGRHVVKIINGGVSAASTHDQGILIKDIFFSKD